MPHRKKSKRRNKKKNKVLSEEQQMKCKTEHSKEDSRSHPVHGYSEMESKSCDVDRMTSLNESTTDLSTDILSTKHIDSSDDRHVLPLHRDLVHQKQKNKSKEHLHDWYTTLVKLTTNDTSADYRTLLNAIESGTYCQAIEMLNGDYTFSQDKIDNALITTCHHGHKYLIQKLIRLGANVQYKDMNGNTPLLISARNGFTDIVRFIIKKKVDINVCDSTGNTALILAIRPSGSTEMVQVLLAQEGINISHQNQDGYTALMKALEAMDIDTVKLLIDKYRKQYLRNNSRLFDRRVDRRVVEEHVNCKGETEQQIADKYGIGSVWKLFNTHTEGSSLLLAAFETSDTELLHILLDSQFLDMIERRSLEDTFRQIIDKYTYFGMSTINDNETAILIRLLEYGQEMNIGLKYTSRLLCVAVSDAKYNLVEFLCKHPDQLKLPLQKRINVRMDALERAANIGRSDIIIHLLTYIDTDTKSYNVCESALIYAITHGHIECAKILIQNGTKIDIKFALDIAVNQQMEKLMNILFENHQQEITEHVSKNASHVTELLITAAVKGNLEIIDKIIGAGADVNGTTSEGETPLTGSRNGDVALFLIRKGANVNLMTSKSNTPLLIVIQSHWYNSSQTPVFSVMGRHWYNSSQTPVFSVMGRHWYNSSQTPLLSVMGRHQYDNSSKTEIVQVLLENGAYVNARNSKGETPLILAASRTNSESMLQTLSDYGANFTDQDNEGNTALIHAALCDCSQNVSFLLESVKNKNEFLNVQNHKGLSALMCAVTRMNINLVQKLIYHDADVNIKDEDGNTALLHTLTQFTEEEPFTFSYDDFSKHESKVVEIMTILISAGSNVNCQNNDGFSPLMKAVSNNLERIISILLDSGADVNAVSVKDNTKTAISFATYKYFINESYISALLKRGANTSYINPDIVIILITKRETYLVFKLIQHGLAPADVPLKTRMSVRGVDMISTVTPFYAALLIGDVSLARYLYEIMFLTNTDVSSLTRNKDIQHILEVNNLQGSINFFNEISLQPLSLFQLTFVSVSSALGPSPGREHRVSKLPIPQVMKDTLLFKS